jgi:hypothetical protein
MRVSLTLPFWVSLAALSAADGGPSGPITGLLVDNAQRSIRPILGMVPGAAYAGDPAVRDMDFGVAAPDGRTALVSRDGSLYIVRRLDGALPVWRQLGDEKPGGPAGWSHDGKSLATVAGDAGHVDFWRKVDSDEPENAGKVDLTYFNETILALAVDSSAAFAFATTRSDAGGSLYLLKPGQMPRLVLTLEKPGRMLLTGDTLFVADRGRREVLRIANWDFSMQVATVATSGHGVADPVGIALSRDGKTLFVASAENRLLVAVEAGSGAGSRSLELDFTPTRLDALAGGAYLLLDNGVPGEAPAQVLDTRTLRVFYLPVRALASAD